MILGELPTRALSGVWRQIGPLVAVGLGLVLLLLPAEWTSAARQFLRVPIPWLPGAHLAEFDDVQRKRLEERLILSEEMIRRLQQDLSAVSAFAGDGGEVHPTAWLLPVRVVLHGDADELRESITIAAGAEVGVAPGDPVVHGSSLLGVVAEVGPRRSVVQLVTDPISRTQAFGEHFGTEVNVEGRGEGRLAIRQRKRLFDAAEGEALLTSRDGKIPRGLILGKVQRPDRPDVIPLWDAASLDSAFVLLSPPSAPEEEE